MRLKSIVIVTLLAVLTANSLHAEVRRVKFTVDNRYLLVEVLDDDLIHFELSVAAGPAATMPLFTSPMVLKTDYPGPSAFSSVDNTYFPHPTDLIILIFCPLHFRSRYRSNLFCFTRP